MSGLQSVLYCGVCTYPIEYCEFSGKLKRCKKWLLDNHPDIYPKYYSNDSKDDELPAVDSSIGVEREEKLEKSLKKLELKEENKEKRELEKKLSSKIIIKRESRTKRKSIVVISGLEILEIDMKKLAKTFASKFATGCAVSKNAEKKDDIVIQGDVLDQMDSYIHGLLEQHGLKNVKVEIIDNSKKKKAEAPKPTK
ncbi:hypothetical protein TBLA_0H02420 [Henningerozyma blattae CBS 6284]|uniref:Translation machinery-associated protein 22 n=1 Tax=Henningerozyma blattae (strain ATCC 34711 / CBS 6284 / DSM 70876 / NBRC 10599 / NRRL Y-10934 / UCD 77-7) TaxID=1071380 RepID=I2H824_HENB6|nr:hypothetical protein TBLA_0H02420 [Tetrapisispora blattae CBS 6284]CCH62526.1 hypothetical protein TBLA_0H02420 [Tetrapisispora blattae CBS 6284]